MGKGLKFLPSSEHEKLSIDNQSESELEDDELEDDELELDDDEELESLLEEDRDFLRRFLDEVDLSFWAFFRFVMLSITSPTSSFSDPNFKRAFSFSSRI